jgi:ADP-heptose:LPS heptosyltransferase
LNRKIRDEKYLAQRHEVEYNIELLSLICENISLPQIGLPVDNLKTLQFLNNNIDLSRKYVVIHPFTSHPLKKIEDEFWTVLVEGIKNRCRKDVVMIGNEAEVPDSLVLEKSLGVKNIVGKLSIRNLATFLKYNCSCFIGVDSGPMHLASILKVPVVGLFKVSDSKRWGPYFAEHLVIDGRADKSLVNRIGDLIRFIAHT